MFNYVILYKLKNKHLLTYLLTIPACVVVAMQRHQIIYYDVTYSQ